MCYPDCLEKEASTDAHWLKCLSYKWQVVCLFPSTSTCTERNPSNSDKYAWRFWCDSQHHKQYDTIARFVRALYLKIDMQAQRMSVASGTYRGYICNCIYSLLWDKHHHMNVIPFNYHSIFVCEREKKRERQGERDFNHNNTSRESRRG